MLQLQVVMTEEVDEATQKLVKTTWPLRLEHSLVSLSKWESKFEKPLLASGENVKEEIFAYVMMMDLDEKTPLEVFLNLTKEDYEAITTYINAKRTATWFNKPPSQKPSRQVVTSELIYYWMSSYEIDWRAETWHLNRLFTLIEVFNEERTAAESKSGNKSVNRTTANSMAAERKRINDERKARLNTTG